MPWRVGQQPLDIVGIRADMPRTWSANLFFNRES
jgi:hypothetical protein